jgi:hypothetical protein
METKKMTLATIQGKLSRAEMKNIMAGSGSLNCITYLGICDSTRTCCSDLKCNTSTGTGACIYK